MKENWEVQTAGGVQFTDLDEIMLEWRFGRRVCPLSGSPIRKNRFGNSRRCTGCRDLVDPDDTVCKLSGHLFAHRAGRTDIPRYDMGPGFPPEFPLPVGEPLLLPYTPHHSHGSFHELELSSPRFIALYRRTHLCWGCMNPLPEGEIGIVQILVRDLIKVTLYSCTDCSKQARTRSGNLGARARMNLEPYVTKYEEMLAAGRSSGR